MTKKRKVYTKEFKLEALKLTKTIPAAQVARDLGISENSLSNWKNKYQKDSENSFPGHGKLKPADEELRRLKRENEVLRQEREILKKALAIFSVAQN